MEISQFRLLLDQCLPRDAAEELRTAGVNCMHAGELGMSDAEDAEILELARFQNAVIVTLDADFHTMLAVGDASKPSVIRVRLQGVTGATLKTLVCQVMERYGEELHKGCMITVKQHKMTCHMLSKSD
jgi:predicted nuclease of predicted toxin-antitoxin system